MYSVFVEDGYAVPQQSSHSLSILSRTDCVMFPPTSGKMTYYSNQYEILVFYNLIDERFMAF